MILQAGYTQLRSISLFISYHTQMITTRLAINMLTTFYKTHTESLLARQARVRRRRGSSCSSPEHSCSCAIFWHPVFSLRCYTCPCRCFSLPCPVCNFSFLISHENLFQTFWQIWCFPPPIQQFPQKSAPWLHNWVVSAMGQSTNARVTLHFFSTKVIVTQEVRKWISYRQLPVKPVGLSISCSTVTFYKLTLTL